MIPLSGNLSKYGKHYTSFSYHPQDDPLKYWDQNHVVIPPQQLIMSKWTNGNKMNEGR